MSPCVRSIPSFRSSSLKHPSSLLPSFLPSLPPSLPAGLMSYLTPYGWVLGATDSCISSSHAHHHSHHSRLSSGHTDDGKAGSVEVLAMALKGGREGGREEEVVED